MIHIYTGSPTRDTGADRCRCKSASRRSVRASPRPVRQRCTWSSAFCTRAGSIFRALGPSFTTRIPARARSIATGDEKKPISAAVHVTSTAAASCGLSASSTCCAAATPRPIDPPRRRKTPGRNRQHVPGVATPGEHTCPTLASTSARRKRGGISIAHFVQSTPKNVRRPSNCPGRLSLK